MNDLFFFSGTRSCGENLFMSSHPTSWSQAIQSWFNEENDFIYGIGPKQKAAVVGHYTQVRKKMKNTHKILP